MQVVTLKLLAPRQLLFTYLPAGRRGTEENDLSQSLIFRIDPGVKTYDAEVWRLVKSQNAKKIQMMIGLGELQETKPIDIDDTIDVGGIRVDPRGDGEPVPVSTKDPQAPTFKPKAQPKPEA